MAVPIPGGTLENVSDGFEPLPAGTYLATVTDGEERVAGEDAKNPGSIYFAWEFTIDDEEYVGRKAWQNTSLTEKALPMLKSFLKGVGYTDDEVNSFTEMPEIEDIVGRQCQLVLKVGKNPKTQLANNSVVRVMPLGEGESELPG